MTNDSPKPRGVIAMTDHLSVNRQVDFVKQLENMGYDSFWIPELFGREVMANASQLISKTDHIRIATGIANIYIRDAHATVQALPKPRPVASHDLDTRLVKLTPGPP